MAHPFFTHRFDCCFDTLLVALADGLEFIFYGEHWFFTKKFFDLFLNLLDHYPILITSTVLVALFWNVVQAFLPCVLTNQDVTEF